MPIRAKCRQCGRVYQVKDKFAGQVLPCKECGGRFRVPEPEPAEAVDFLDEGDLLVEDDGFDELAPRSASSKRRRPAAAGDPWEDEFGGASGSGGGTGPTRKRRPPTSEPPVRPEKPARGGKPGRSKRRAAKSPGMLDDTSFRYAAVGGIALLILGTFGWMIWARSSGGSADNSAAVAGDGAEAFPVASVPVPPMQPLPGMRPWQFGTQIAEVSLGNGGPAGHAMRLRVYLPPGEHAPQSLPCVLLAPAGTNMLVGMKLDDLSYTDETMPYLRAGFAVVHYSLDGAVGDLETMSLDEFRAGYERFRDAHAGVVNGRNALEYVLRHVPMVDPSRVYAVGHSSAATVALLVAAHEPRLAGCIAYAAPVDVYQELEDFGAFDMPEFESLEGIEAFARQSSPINHATRLKRPLFLFHARDDDVQSYQSSERLAAAVRENGGEVTLRLTNIGGHHDAMTREGIPAAIAWLKSRPENQIRNQIRNRNQDRPQPSGPGSGAASNPPLASNSDTYNGPPGPLPPNARPGAPSAQPGTPSAQPLGDSGPMPPPGMAVVVFELKGYTGDQPPRFAAISALQRVRWVRMPLIRIEGSQNRLIIGVRGGSVNTGQAKTALEARGFQLGGGAYHGSGL